MIPVREDIRLCLGLPVYGNYHAHFVHGLLRLVKNPPCHLQLMPLVGDSLVSRARNRIAAQFMAAEKATHLLFLDTDLVFSVDHVARLISHDLPLVAGLYPKKQRKLKWVVNTRSEFGEADEAGLQKVLYAGTGCLLIAREVFQAIREARPDLRYDPDAGESDQLDYYDYFKVGVHEDPETGARRYLSEDWYFCQLARECGYDIVADTHVMLKHLGEIAYPLDDPTAPEDLS